MAYCSVVKVPEAEGAVPSLQPTRLAEALASAGPRGARLSTQSSASQIDRPVTSWMFLPARVVAVASGRRR